MTHSVSTDPSICGVLYVVAMMGSVLSNGFQLIVSGSQPKALNDFQIVNLQVNC